MAAPAKRKLTRQRSPEFRTAIAAAMVALTLTIVVWRNTMPPDKEKAFPAGAIVVGVDASYPPFAVDDGQSLHGLDIDLAIAIGRELDLPVRFVNIGFYSLYDALISGEVDLLISGLLVDPARMDDVRYTQHYFDNGLALVTAPNAVPAKIKALAGRSIAYEYASSADSLIRAWERDEIAVRRLPYELPVYALDALRLNQADAALVDHTTWRLYQRDHSDWQAGLRFFTHEHYAIAARNDRVDAWKLADRAITALKDSGELVRIIDKWL